MKISHEYESEERRKADGGDFWRLEPILGFNTLNFHVVEKSLLLIHFSSTENK